MSISTYRRYRRGRALPIWGLHPIPHEAPHPPHAGPRRQRAADHCDGPRRVRRGQPALRPAHRAQALPRARRRAPGDGARQRLAPAPPLRAAGASSSTPWSASTSAGATRASAMPTADVEEVARLHRAFDRMLERLEAERARTATAVLQAQEGERARLARDLHDEANQALTGVLLRLRGHRPGRAARAARRAARDAGRRHAGDGRAPAPGPRAAPRRRSTTSASAPPCARRSTSSAAAPA